MLASLGSSLLNGRTPYFELVRPRILSGDGRMTRVALPAGSYESGQFIRAFPWRRNRFGDPSVLSHPRLIAPVLIPRRVGFGALASMARHIHPTLIARPVSSGVVPTRSLVVDLEGDEFFTGIATWRGGVDMLITDEPRGDIFDEFSLDVAFDESLVDEIVLSVTDGDLSPPLYDAESRVLTIYLTHDETWSTIAAYLAGLDAAANPAAVSIGLNGDPEYYGPLYPLGFGDDGDVLTTRYAVPHGRLPAQVRVTLTDALDMGSTWELVVRAGRSRSEVWVDEEARRITWLLHRTAQLSVVAGAFQTATDGPPGRNRYLVSPVRAQRLPGLDLVSLTLPGEATTATLRFEREGERVSGLLGAPVASARVRPPLRNHYDPDWPPPRFGTPFVEALHVAGKLNVAPARLGAPSIRSPRLIGPVLHAQAPLALGAPYARARHRHPTLSAQRGVPLRTLRIAVEGDTPETPHRRLDAVVEFRIQDRDYSREPAYSLSIRTARRLTATVDATLYRLVWGIPSTIVLDTAISAWDRRRATVRVRRVSGRGDLVDVTPRGMNAATYHFLRHFGRSVSGQFGDKTSRASLRGPILHTLSEPITLGAPVASAVLAHPPLVPAAPLALGPPGVVSPRLAAPVLIPISPRLMGTPLASARHRYPELHVAPVYLGTPRIDAGHRHPTFAAYAEFGSPRSQGIVTVGEPEMVYGGAAGASQALLRVQHALVERFDRYAAGHEGLRATFRHLGLSDYLPSPRLYDEPPAGGAAFFRLGEASIDYETASGIHLWTISQEIEAHIDPVRGRAAVLAMADVIERAFEPQLYRAGPPNGESEPETWLTHANLSLRDIHGVAHTSPLRVTDITPSATRVGFSAGGLTYQAIITYEIVAEPIHG